MMKAIASHEGGLTWQQAVKKVIRNVMVEYYRAVPSLRSSFSMLKRIETCGICAFTAIIKNSAREEWLCS